MIRPADGSGTALATSVTDSSVAITAPARTVSSLPLRTISVTGSCTVIAMSSVPSNVGDVGSSRSSIAYRDGVTVRGRR